MTVTHSRIARLEEKLGSIAKGNKPNLEGLSGEKLEQAFHSEYAELVSGEIPVTADRITAFWRRWGQHPTPSFIKLFGPGRSTGDTHG